MESKVQKQIIDYFSFFEEFHNSCKTCLKDCQNCALDINKLNKRCRNIKEAEVVGTCVEEFSGLQSKLCASLHNLISEEIADIRSNLSTLEELFEKLCYKNRTLLEECRSINILEETPLIKGTPLQPPLEKLLEFASDTLTFGSEVCAQIQTSLKVLAFKGLDTEPFVENLKISARWQRKVSEILAYTTFCSQNQI